MEHRQFFYRDEDGEYRWHDEPQGHIGNCGQTYTGAKPLESVAAAVHPKQVKEARERMKRMGLSGVDYKRDGTCVFTSRGSQGRRGYLKAMGMHDNNSFYD